MGFDVLNNCLNKHKSGLKQSNFNHLTFETYLMTVRIICQIFILTLKLPYRNDVIISCIYYTKVSKANYKKFFCGVISCKWFQYSIVIFSLWHICSVDVLQCCTIAWIPCGKMFWTVCIVTLVPPLVLCQIRSLWPQRWYKERSQASSEDEGDTWMSLIMSGHMGSMWPSIVMLQQNTSTEQSALS